LVWPAARGAGGAKFGETGMDGEELGRGDDDGQGDIGLAIRVAAKLRPKCLIQYTPVPGIPKERYRRPSGDTPRRTPHTPTLPPIPSWRGSSEMALFPILYGGANPSRDTLRRVA
jgi:hypothetical protein